MHPGQHALDYHNILTDGLSLSASYAISVVFLIRSFAHLLLNARTPRSVCICASIAALNMCDKFT